MEATRKKKSLFTAFKDKFKVYNDQIRWPIFLAVATFSTVQWIDIFAIWSELPLMVHELEEGWRLPAIITVTIQVGQIISLLYLIIYFKFKRKSLYRIAIYLKFTITTAAILVLSFVWKKSAFIFKERRSIGLIIISLVFALFDGVSNLSFLPYVGDNFTKEYLIPYYIGESLFSLVPSVLAILQGIGKDQGCYNVTVSKTERINETFSLYTNQTTLEPIPLQPKFSISVYYIITFGLMCICFAAFLYIDCCKSAKCPLRRNNDLLNSQSGNTATAEEQTKSLLNKPASADPDQEPDSLCSKEKLLLYTLNFMLTFFYYGILSGIQTYSALPYGNDAYHLAVNLSNMLLPVSIFLSIWSYSVTIRRILIEFGIFMLFIVYIIVTAGMSPCPPLVNHKLGSVIIILSWIICQSLFMRVKCIIATRLERFGEKTLTILGCFTILGEVVGGIIVYVVVDVFRLLTEQSACDPISCTA